MKQRINNSSFKLTLIFSFIVFLILISTIAILGIMMIILLHLGILSHPRWEFFLFIPIAGSIAVGMLFSLHLSRPIISNITKISEATKEITHGNFNVSIDEKIHATEMRTMAHNFNLMALQLSKTEIFRHDFIHNVSHEFKTPLAAIEGYATLLKNDSLPEQKRILYLDRILFNTRRLTTLTGNILQLSRLENQTITPQKELFSLDEQIREMILLFEAQWTKKELDLDIELASIDYWGNSELLSQVWQNLIGNAVKFSKQNGFLRIILKKVKNHIEVSVSDNGGGMSPETAERIFEKFYQGDTSHSEEGNGLGLPLAKKIVEIHGGTIDVSTKEGRGTTFTVTLPLNQQ